MGIATKTSISVTRRFMPQISASSRFQICKGMANDLSGRGQISSCSWRPFQRYIDFMSDVARSEMAGIGLGDLITNTCKASPHGTLGPDEIKGLIDLSIGNLEGPVSAENIWRSVSALRTYLDRKMTSGIHDNVLHAFPEIALEMRDEAAFHTSIMMEAVFHKAVPAIGIRWVSTMVPESRFHACKRYCADPSLLRYGMLELARIFADNARQFSPAYRSESDSDMYIETFFKLLGRKPKCFVLDCDGVLWDGVLGDDGLSGITIDKYGYDDFQRMMLGFKDRGFLLAISSKNEESDVLEVLKTHPEMVLREHDLVDIMANHDEKVLNIRRIAAGLNIGTDSFIFLDDSDFERAKMSAACPEVMTIPLPAATTYYRDIKDRLNLIKFIELLLKDDNPISAEAGRRTELYAAKRMRERFLTGFRSLEEGLMELGIQIAVVDDPHDETVRRVELINRTNQFNLTGRKYDYNELRRMAGDPKYRFFNLHLRTKIKDEGTAGVMILKKDDEDIWNIDVFCFSCRAVGINAERAFVHSVLRALKAEGVSELRAEYVRSPKNSMVADLYSDLGFELVSAGPDGAHYRLDLTDEKACESVKWIAVYDTGRIHTTTFTCGEGDEVIAGLKKAGAFILDITNTDYDSNTEIRTYTIRYVEKTRD